MRGSGRLQAELHVSAGGQTFPAGGLVPPPSQLVLGPPWVSLHGHLSPWTLRQGTAASVTQTTVPHALPPTEDGLQEGAQEMSSAWTKVSAGSLVS